MNLHQLIEDALDQLDEAVAFSAHRARFEAACTGAWFKIHRHKHTWQYVARFSQQRIYYLRRCECSQEQIQSAGPIGDSQWRDLRTKVWRNQWEWEDFQSAAEEKQ